LRFYTPAGFTKIDPSQYNYNKDITEKTDNEKNNGGITAQ